MSGLLDDLRLAVRQLWRNPGFTLAAVVCLALGIGGNTAVFSVASAFFLDERGIASPERLAWLMVEWKDGLKWGAWSYPDYLDLRRDARLFTELCAETPQRLHLSDGGRSERLWGAMVSGNYFRTLGVKAAIGRTFEGDEGEVQGVGAVAVLSHGLWQRHFGADPGVIGRGLTLNSLPFTVVGVAPRGFRSPNVGFAPDLWVPISQPEVFGLDDQRLGARGWQWIAFVIGRLAPGVSVEQAQAGVDAAMTRLREVHPDSNTGKAARVYKESEAALHPMVHGAFVAFLQALFAVVGLVLLLASANVAGLLLARAVARRPEMAVRLALGASRGLLLRQLLAESLLLTLLAGGVGLLLGLWTTRVLGALQPSVDLPLDFSLGGLNAVVLAFTLGISLLAGLVFGMAPALESARTDLVSVLKQGVSSAGTAVSRLRRGLVVAQVALSLVLLIAAGLTLRSLVNAGDVDLGFEPDGQALVSIDLGLQRYEPRRGEAFFAALREGTLGLPTVEAAGYGVGVPLSLFNSQASMLPEGHVVAAGANAPTIDYNFAGPGYFEAMRAAVLRGRPFEDRDGEKGREVAVVNEAFARRFWPGGDAIGKRVGVLGHELAVVGVVEDGRYWSLGEEPRPYLYLPIGIQYRAERVLHVRTAADPASLLGALRQEIRALDPTLPAEVKTMREHLRFTLFPARLLATALTSFSALALLLAAVGVYGVVAFWVNQATREIGLRMALGAQPREVLSLVVRRAIPEVALGLALGLAVALAGAHLAAGLLYGVDPVDPRAYLAAAALLGGVALVATLLPARRASRVDPATALRAE